MPILRLRGTKERILISRLSRRRQVVIPKSICEKLGLGEGDTIEITKNRGRIVLKPIKRIRNPRIERLTPEEERIVAKGLRQLKRGQYLTWDQLRHELDL